VAGFAAALSSAQAGDGSALRDLTDQIAYERTPEWRYPNRIGPFLEAGRHAAGLFEHTYLNSGYSELPIGLSSIKPQGAYRGSFRHHTGATPALVIGTNHDTWTPFAWARRLVADLGNAWFLTFRGDGHDALTSFSPCIVGAMLGYLEEGALPAPGSACRRDPPF
jgi:hypothetical protein